MEMKKYKNTSNADQLFDGAGVVKPGETIETDVETSNPNFELIENE